MVSALIIAFVLIVAIPVAVMLSGMALAAIIGWCLKEDAEANSPSPELIEVNV